MRISIITINRNNASGLRKTIESVVSQTVQPYEFIIIDGASFDGSQNLLLEFSEYITSSVSEPDSGIYNAMNKGVRYANGDWCIFLNSGDTLNGPDVLEFLVSSGANTDIICGNTELLSNPTFVKKAMNEISLNRLYACSICHQSALIKTSLLREYPYDESLKIVSDRKFFLQTLIIDNCSYSTVDITIASYNMEGYSALHPYDSRREWEDVLSKMIPERILIDYGRRYEGSLFGLQTYNNFFVETSKRRYKRLVYFLSRNLLFFLSFFRSSARYVRKYPKTC